eukprot:gb/GEZN01004766.1/.p1 GENE.gb/GEZN01004766.1/~~gb/GEZN01004766.1/.p1  ORF type:complete len:505 (+),score=76.23 gb/GEZN01004766.1/:85-1599(+)
MFQLVSWVLLLSLFFVASASPKDFLVVHDLPEGAIRVGSSWLAHANFPQKFQTDIEKSLAEEKLTDLRQHFEAAGFPIIKTLAHHMFRFDVETDHNLSPSELRDHIRLRPLLAAAIERLQVELNIEANVRYFASETQINPVWNLDRIDQQPKELDLRFGHLEDGDNANIYIMDSGIRLTHEDFEGRAKFFWSAFDGGADTGDCNGHGTHVAGTAVSKTYGVAKKATVWSIKVLDCNGWGSTATILDAMDVMAAKAKSHAVLSMSLGGPRSYIMDLKANILTQTVGVLIIVAAGNDNVDACSQSPARNGGVITVGASTSSDSKASFSNWGKCLDIFAPGQNIRSLSAFSDTDTAVYSGTSMAAPLVSGVAALWLDYDPAITPEEMFNVIARNSTLDALRGIGEGSPNRLLYQPFNEGYDYVPPPNPYFKIIQDKWMMAIGVLLVLGVGFCVYYSRRHNVPKPETLLVAGSGLGGNHVGVSDDVLSPMDLMPYEVADQNYVPPNDF